MKHNLLFFATALLLGIQSYAQTGVAINPTGADPHPSAMLDVSADNKGFLAPQVALTSSTDVTTIVSPATGLLIYNIATAGSPPTNVVPGYYYFDGTSWKRFDTGSVSGVAATAPIISSGSSAPVISISAATTSTSGSMSAADKTKLDDLVTNQTHTGDVTGSIGLTIANKVTMTGTLPVTVSGSPIVIATAPVAISIAPVTTSAAGSMSAADKTKLDGITGINTGDQTTITGNAGSATKLSAGNDSTVLAILKAGTKGDLLYKTSNSGAWAKLTIGGYGSYLRVGNDSLPYWDLCGPGRNTAGAASSTPTTCINAAMAAVTHTTTNATGIGSATGLPAGIAAAWESNTITISGTPTQAGTFNYNIPLTGGCGTANATGAITVTPLMTAGTASSNPTLCINTALTAITRTTTGATGIGTATGLPAGVSASWATNTITVSGTPTAAGTFNYSIPLTGGCGTVNATGTITVNINTAGTASSNPTLCINTPLTAITRTTTGATGIGTATGLPAGVTAAWASNTLTVSGTPTASGTFNYSIPLTGGCGSVNATGTITVTPLMTAGTASSNPTLCINTPLTEITRTTTGATGIGTPTGLPAGVSANWASNTITLSGTPTAAGTFNYSIPLTGGCGTVNATGSIVVTANMTAGTASSNPTLCINTALTAITRTTTGATGIGTATGLPAGVTAAWASNTITVSGTPTASGTFNYSIPLTGGCGTVNATGSITVTAQNTAGTASSNPTLCINTPLTAITRTTTGATGIGTATGLPAGVTAAWATNTITVSGTPTASGTFNYSIPLTGGCGSVNATGTITVTPLMTAGTASSNPALCINTALTAITRTTTGATGIGTATGLPDGVTANWASNVITVSGTPTEAGTFNYSIPLTGGCGTVNATGTITVNINTAGTASSTPTLCINTPLTAITHTTTGATGIGTATGLPAGVSAAWASNTITISGTPSESGIFNYSIPLTGGCGIVDATGEITVTALMTAGAASATPTAIANTLLIPTITHTTESATGIGSATGLPAGVTAAWENNTITISGTPTVVGTYNYSIPLTGGCGTVNATGSITVTAVCGSSIAISHVAGNVAPVTKSVTYGIVTSGLTGAYKCWITQNLGSTNQAASAGDGSEAAAGWYWQFNRKQGFKHDGTTRTPGTWDSSRDNSSSTWEAAKDPCTIELGAGWRIPTRTEWTNADANGGWVDYNSTYNSVLKIHAAGNLNGSAGTLGYRGGPANYFGYYWSSNQNNYDYAYFLDFDSNNHCGMDYNYKSYGFSVRCVRD